MKKIKYLSLILLSAFFVNCSNEDNGQVAYNGAALLSFLGDTQQVYVFSDTGSTEATITYGVLKPVSGTNTVTLVPDTENSTAVEGVDYEIVTGTDELSDGEVAGSFKIKFLEAPATQDGKVAVFKLQSATLSNAVFNDSYTVNVNLTCPVESFVGDFESNTWWNGPGLNTVSVGADNSMLIEGFWLDQDPVGDFVLTYNPDTFVVTFTEQPTGYVGAQGPINARPAVGKVSLFNPCTRELTLQVNYWIPNVGTYGDKVEVFTGI